MLGALAVSRPDAADELRRRLEARWPRAKWNTLIERVDSGVGGHFYYSEEQFNLNVVGLEDASHKSHSLSVAVFDRRCHTLTTLAEEEEGRTYRGS